MREYSVWEHPKNFAKPFAANGCIGGAECENRAERFFANTEGLTVSLGFRVPLQKIADAPERYEFFLPKRAKISFEF